MSVSNPLLSYVSSLQSVNILWALFSTWRLILSDKELVVREKAYYFALNSSTFQCVKHMRKKARKYLV